jgi:hypothetical protein
MTEPLKTCSLVYQKHEFNKKVDSKTACQIVRDKIKNAQKLITTQSSTTSQT